MENKRTKKVFKILKSNKAPMIYAFISTYFTEKERETERERECVCVCFVWIRKWMNKDKYSHTKIVAATLGYWFKFPFSASQPACPQKHEINNTNRIKVQNHIVFFNYFHYV
jgi:hypothetical protein